MELLLLDDQFEAIEIIDYFESMIWTDRYNKCGDFEIYLPISAHVASVIRQNYYIWSSESEHMMIVEELEIKSDAETGNNLIVTGRSLESILDRRIIWNQTTLTGSLETKIQELLNQNVISPSLSYRQIPNFIFAASGDAYIQSLTIDNQYTGDNLYDVIAGLCEQFGIGFKITLNDQNQFVFQLYSGVDRSYNQTSNPYVVFSPNFENIINSDYIDSIKDYKNAALVAGEGEGTDRKTIEVRSDESTGLARREHYTDARDISSTDGETTIQPAEYNNLLTNRGKEELAQNKVYKSFDGEVETSLLYKYGRDFFMGDDIQLENAYGMTAKSRVVEYIFSESPDGIKSYPTFDVVEED